MQVKKSILFLRLLFYILILSFVLSQLFLFGILMMIPMDLMFFAEENANVWGFLVPFFVGSLTMYVLHKIKTVKNTKFAVNSRKYALAIGLLLSIVFSGILLIVFLNFTKYNQEPWLIQGGWFMRFHGVIWSILLGSLVFTGILTIDEMFQFKDIFQGTLLIKIGKAKWELTVGAVVSLFTLALTFVFSGFELLFYRISTLFGAFLFTFIVIIVLSILYISSKGIEFTDNFELSNKESIDSFKTELTQSDRKNSRRKSALLLSLSLASLTTMVLYFFKINFELNYPPGVNANHFIFPIQQLITIILGAFVGIVVTIGFSRFILQNSVFGEIKPSSNHIINKIIQFLFGIAIFAAVTFLIVILGLSLYIFEFTLYLPQVIGYTFVWAVVGVFLFIFIEKIKLKPRLRQTLSYTMVFIALLSIITNFWKLTLDLVENNTEIKSGAYDITFPFEFLFSNKNIIMVGLAMGYLLSLFMKPLMKGLKNTNMARYKNSTSILFFFLAPVAIGCLIGFSSMIIDLPGGDPTLAIMGSDKILPIIRFGILILLGLLLFKFNISAARKDKEVKARSEEVPSIIIKEILKSVTQSSKSNGVNPNTKVKATAIISVVIISILSGGLGALIGVTALNARSMPVLVSTSGYDLWMANSSERFNHQTKIAVSTSPQIDEVTFNMAKNEYYAFQLGMTLKSKNAYFHSYYLTDFVGVENSSEVISSEAAQLRYEDYILEEEFPDKLLPIEGNPILLNKRQTHMFWFDIRTPYDLSSGHFAGTLTITFKLGDIYLEEHIPIQFFVWDFAIPHQKHVTTNVGDASVPANVYNELVENWLDHRFNSYAQDIKGTDDYDVFEWYNGYYYIYYLNKSDGSVTFNWTLWDIGIESLLNVTNAPMNGIRVDYSLGRSLKIGNATENQWFLNWLIEVEQHLELKGWLNICYYYFVDEFSLFIPEEYTRAEYYVAVEEQLASMKYAAPKLRIMVVAPPLPDLEPIKPYIDIYVPLSYDRDVDEWEQALGQGKEIWHYTCVGPFAPYPNVHLYNRLFETRIQMWNSWAWNIHGYLFWRANSYSHGQYGLGYNSWGDGWLIYIDEAAGRIYDSIRWENLGESQEDYEMFWLLNATLNDLEDNALLSQPEIEAYRSELDNIVDKVTDDFLDYTNDPHDIYNGYNRIGHILHTLSGLTDIKMIGETPWYPVSGVSP
ncbi:MAG: DUF4091 domain-containing protein [Promethearchaeota archaeon]|nr:MAG: DUF4091 domain-containing protein [Candidatus Lokiarchaeota archaeon]